MFHSPSDLAPISCGQRVSMEDMVSHPAVDLVLVATSGTIGLHPLLAALRAGKRVALANKESLVMAGHIVTARARQSGTRLLPVDSEHSAIWQCIQGENSDVSRLYITASGGPFYWTPSFDLEAISPEQALGHPVWNMGRKITIDSATLMNKGLEVIEAHWLFGVPFDRIEVLVHPQCVVHSMVEFVDGSVKAQLGVPDMKLPIQYALSCGERILNPALPRVDFGMMSSLTFESVVVARFPCFELALEVGKRGGTFPAVLCAADAVAVEHFLAGKIRFTDVPVVVEETLSQHTSVQEPALEAVLAADSWARDKATELAAVRQKGR